MEPAKRIKLDVEQQEDRLLICKSVLSDEHFNLPKTVDFYVGSVDDNKIISKLMKEINEILPVSQIQFLKRVCKGEFLLCSDEDFQTYLKEFNISYDNTDSNSNIFKKLLLEKGLSKEIVDKICAKIRLIKVPESQPFLRWQFEVLKDVWPCKFHENKYLETLAQNKVFSTCETKVHNEFIKICDFLSEKLEGRDVGLVVNPYTKKIVSFGYSKVEENPVKHCAMMLVDHVAITQNGGAWYKEFDQEYMNLQNEIKLKFPKVEFGEDPFDKEKALKYQNEEDNLLKFGPYLCTGYYVYLLNEPCLMCAMALIHSRVKRVFYNKSNKLKGALGSITMLHTKKNLNHHYEVFQMVPASE